MEKKPWRALKSRKRKRFKGYWGRRKDRLSEPQRSKANWGPRKDRLSELPDDILLSILFMASSTLKEAARTSLVSHRWSNLWRYFPILNFEDSREVGMARKVSDEIRCLEKDNFVQWVNLVVQHHLCQSVDAFRVAFDLEDRYQCHIDKWVAFVSEKKVKRLELDFRPIHYYKSLSTCNPELPHNSGSSMSTLTSLRLIYVRVTAQVVECLLDSCPLLENLYIEKSENLTSIRASSSSLTLKHLAVVQCYNMEAVDISTPNLLSFRYDGPRIELHIRNGSSLSEVMFGCFHREISINYAFDSLSKYFPQLEFLSLRISLLEELNMGINYVPALTKLKHLELVVQARCEQSLFGWIPLIEACPILEKLTLKLFVGDFPMGEEVEPRGRGRSLKCLKTLVIDGFVGLFIDLEMAIYVCNNAPMLEEVIVDAIDPCWPERGPNQRALKRLPELEREIPRSVELYLKRS